MSELLQFATNDGNAVVVEVDASEPGFELASREGSIVQAKMLFGEALQHVRNASWAALKAFRDGPLRPDDIEIEFGVRFNAEAGAVIAKTSTEGHLVVKLTWSSQGRTP